MAATKSARMRSSILAVIVGLKFSRKVFLDSWLAILGPALQEYCTLSSQRCVTREQMCVESEEVRGSPSSK
jgi:hypothetical protein